MSDAKKAAAALRSARHAIAFTGAGISVESGIPPFRGGDGVWNKYDPATLDLGYFVHHPGECWPVLKEIFYDFLAEARPNRAHQALATLEQRGMLHAVVTQNIDDLHRQAGSRRVLEFHGNYRRLTCLGCSARYGVADINLVDLPPTCRMCGGVLKPDIVFFGEAIPPQTHAEAVEEAHACDVVLVVGTSGEVMPACLIPRFAAENGATVIEVNTEPTTFSMTITSIFLQGKAGEVLSGIIDELGVA
jgi:NAD-dependent deacetylase